MGAERSRTVPSVAHNAHRLVGVDRNLSLLFIICAEYDALPGIGHSCGHNLIATSSIATFIAVAESMKKHNIQGRVRILGTPAEEGGGGKAKLIEAGAFPKDTAAAIMVREYNRELTASFLF